MNCEEATRLLSLYYYGELAPEDEERVDEHIHTCAACAREMEAQRVLAQALDRRKLEAPADLLAACRADLEQALGGVPARGAVRRTGAWRLFLAAWRQPLGAVALLALGFFGARFTGQRAEAPSAQVFSTIRSVRPDAAGRVAISFDETRRREVSGPLNDAGIQQLLLAAAREESSAAVRVESVDLLRSRPGSGEVRSALLNALAHDPNVGVRLRALEGLRPLAADAALRRTLAAVLLTDDSPAVRIQVVDLLVAQRDESTIGVLQGLVQKDDNNFVRLKCEKALKDMNASVGTF
jgi:hypothetical protein